MKKIEIYSNNKLIAIYKVNIFENPYKVTILKEHFSVLGCTVIIKDEA